MRRLIILLLLATMVASCGRRGDLEPPPAQSLSAPSLLSGLAL